MAKNDEKIITSAELVTISILQAIKVDLLLKKTELQKNGQVIEEDFLEDEPDVSMFIPDTPPKIESKQTFDLLIEAQLKKSKEDAQITVDEAIQDAQKVINQPQPQAQAQTQNQESAQQSAPKKEPFKQWQAQYYAFLASRGAWQVRKQQLDYDHKRKRIDSVNLCYGIDYAISLIDQEIERQRFGKGIKVKETIEGEQQQ